MSVTHFCSQPLEGLVATVNIVGWSYALGFVLIGLRASQVILDLADIKGRLKPQDRFFNLFLG